MVSKVHRTYGAGILVSSFFLAYAKRLVSKNVLIDIHDKLRY